MEQMTSKKWYLIKKKPKSPFLGQADEAKGREWITGTNCNDLKHTHTWVVGMDFSKKVNTAEYPT